MLRRPSPVGSEAVRKSDGQTRRAVLAMFAMAMLVLLSNRCHLARSSCTSSSAKLQMPQSVGHCWGTGGR
jgi:hypothetical protein